MAIGKEHNAMQNTNTRLHPLLTAAAISVTVFSAVGVASLTGLLPESMGSQKEEIIQQVEPAIEPAMSQPPAQPAAKPVKKPVAKVDKPRPAEPVVYREIAEAPKPVVQALNLATVQAVREVKQPGEHTAAGPIAGGVAGAVIGSQIGGGNGKKVMTVLGALGGAMAGKHIEKQARATSRWEIDVRHDSGLHETVLSDVAPPYGAGSRVRVIDGRLQPA
ncbi:MAG TPA: glycine zipper 2TM domain-containing protein [Burkholderiales bacterium]|nr:glycine zipper 2TM domain-containing protein [Burkholderiales bacterium]